MSEPRQCALCGRPLRPEASFCTFCGGRTGGSQPKEVAVEAAVPAAGEAERTSGTPVWAKITAAAVVIVGLAAGLGIYFGTQPDGGVNGLPTLPVATTMAPATTEATLPPATTTTRPTTTTTVATTTTTVADTTADEWVPGQPPADWSRFSGANAEMYLPSTYEGTAPETALPVILDYLKGLGPQYASWVQELEGMDLATMPIFAFDASQVDTGSVDNVNVGVDTTAAGEVVGIDELISTGIDAVESLGARVVNSGQVYINGVVAARLASESEVGGKEVSQVVFGLVDSYGFWQITFTTTRDRFSKVEATFDQSASTFRTGL